jgi:anti-sigma factor RsiW
MMAAGKNLMEREPSEVELLLPWHAAGTLNARDSRKVDEALARDPELARQYAVIREEYAETIDLNESLGAPSALAMQKLFAAIDAEPARRSRSYRSLASRFAAFFASLSPRTLAWSASLAVLVLIVQAGVIGTVLMNRQLTSFQTASLSNDESNTRDVSLAAPSRALVRFAPDARLGEVTALLDKYHAAIIETAQGGMFRVQFADSGMSQDQFSSLLGRLQKEKIVSFAVATP